MNIIETDNLCKQYGAALRVAHLDMRVPEGSVYGFLGPNGAGKSTTLKMLLGLVRQEHGQRQPPGDIAPGGESHREPQLLRPPHRGGEPADRPDPPGCTGKRYPGGAGDRPPGRTERQESGPLFSGHEAAPQRKKLRFCTRWIPFGGPGRVILIV